MVLFLDGLTPDNELIHLRGSPDSEDYFSLDALRLFHSGNASDSEEFRQRGCFLNQLTSLSEVPLYLEHIDSCMSAAGFVRFPSTERPFTYRSGKSLSTIDYAFMRNVNVLQFNVAR
jgi:hypothetical protein